MYSIREIDTNNEALEAFRSLHKHLDTTPELHKFLHFLTKIKCHIDEPMEVRIDVYCNPPKDDNSLEAMQKAMSHEIHLSRVPLTDFFFDFSNFSTDGQLTIHLKTERHIVDIKDFNISQYDLGANNQNHEKFYFRSEGREVVIYCFDN